MKDVHVFESLAIPVDSSGNIVICGSERERERGVREYYYLWERWRGWKVRCDMKRESGEMGGEGVERERSE